MKTIIIYALTVIAIVLAILFVYSDVWSYDYTYRATPVVAQQTILRFNPYDDRTSYQFRRDRIRYNPYEDDFTYQRPDARIKYNPWTDDFEWDR